MGSCISGEGTMSYTTFGTWGMGDEGDKISKCYTFDLFTLIILKYSLNNTVIPCGFFFSFLAENYESYLIYVKKKYTPLPPLILIKIYEIRTWCQNLTRHLSVLK